MDAVLVALVIFAAWCAQISIHESCHALMAKCITKAKVVTFKPWPHLWRDWFYMGRTEIADNGDLTRLDKIYILIAPLFGATAVLFFYAFLPGILVVASIAPILDIVLWVICFVLQCTRNDGATVRELWRELDT